MFPRFDINCYTWFGHGYEALEVRKIKENKKLCMKTETVSTNERKRCTITLTMKHPERVSGN